MLFRSLLNDKEFVLEAAKQGKGGVLLYVPDNLRNDKEIILEAVKKHGLDLEYASDDLKLDIDVEQTYARSVELAEKLWDRF